MIKEFIWTKLIPFKFFIWVRDKKLNHPTKHRKIRKILFSPRNSPYYDLFNFIMDDEMAKWVRDLYTNNWTTCRMLSRDFKKRYPNTNIQSEDQYDGEWLIKYVEDYLNIDLYKEAKNNPNWQKSREFYVQIFKEAFKKE